MLSSNGPKVMLFINIKSVFFCLVEVVLSISEYIIILTTLIYQIKAMVYINYTIFYTLFKYGTRVCNKRLYNYLLPDLELQHVNRINNYAIFI